MLLEGRYETLEKVGEGAYGVVYKAVDHTPQPMNATNPWLSSILSHIPEHEARGDSEGMGELGKLLVSSLKVQRPSPASENVDPNPRRTAASPAEETKGGKQALVAIKKLRMMEVPIGAVTRAEHGGQAVCTHGGGQAATRAAASSHHKSGIRTR